jgi:hypothetical protein
MTRTNVRVLITASVLLPVPFAPRIVYLKGRQRRHVGQLLNDFRAVWTIWDKRRILLWAFGAQKKLPAFL